MPVWLVRAGSRGERQDLALDQNVVVVGWDDLPDLSQFQTREKLEAAFRRTYPDVASATIARSSHAEILYHKRSFMGKYLCVR